MRHERLFLPLLAGILAGGCDYWTLDRYNIVNNTSDTIKLVINTDSLGWFNDVNFRENNFTKLNDSTHVVYPRSKITLETGGELCGKYYRPDDRRYNGEDIYFWGRYVKAAYANTQPVDSAYWNPEKWTFESKRRMRLYQLTFDEK